MKLRALELEQFRKFTRPVRLAGFGDRVNLLCGANEFGKSTMLAAIRCLLFERHSSTGQSIKQMQSWGGDAAPRLAMEFELGTGIWRIEKRFLHRKMAQLTAPDGARFDGDAAEEQLQRVLGFGAAGRRGAGQMGVWGALWVTQRDSVLQADLSSDSARSTITNCLDAEVGVMTGTEKGQALIRAARDQLGQLLDGNGKPRGRHKEVSTRLQELTSELTALRDRAERLADDAATLRQKDRLLARESDPAGEARDTAELETARRRLTAAQLHQEQIANARAAHTLAAREAADARTEQAARAARLQEITQAETALAKAQSSGATRATRIAEARQTLATQRDSLTQAQQRATQAATALRRLRQLAELSRRAADLAQHQHHLDAAEAAQANVDARRAALEQNPVDQPLIERIREAARALDTARGLRDAQATQVALDLLPGQSTNVTIAGQPVAASQTLLNVAEETELAIAGIGTIRIRPAIRDLPRLAKRIAAAVDALAAALADADCADLAAAERRSTERERLQRGLADARAEVVRLAPGDPSLSLRPGIAPLREHVAVERARLADDATPLPDIAAQIASAETNELQATDAAAQARAAVDTASEQLTILQVEAARADSQWDSAKAQLARLSEDATAAQHREADASLEQRRTQAETQRDTQDRRLTDFLREATGDTPQAMQARVERYEQAIHNRREAVRRLREDVIILRTRIASEGGNGLDELIAGKQREADMLTAEQTALQTEIRTLRLLLDTLAAAERETKEQYLAPIIRRVTPYLAGLFPGVTVTCDDSLRITGLTRGGRDEEAFDRLSDGTQEQIAVLARLAFAEMLVDQGKPAMVILDDALAYSDSDRLERMFDIVAQASAKMQILVLTCREDLFARLGGNRLEIAPVG